MENRGFRIKNVDLDNLIMIMELKWLLAMCDETNMQTIREVLRKLICIN